MKALREEAKSKAPEPSGGESQAETKDLLGSFLDLKGLGVKQKEEEQKVEVEESHFL